MCATYINNKSPFYHTQTHTQKLKSDTTSKFLNDVNKFESVKTTREKMAGVSKTNPSPPLRPSSTSKIAVVDNDYDPSIGEDEPPIDVETVKKFLGTKALLDSSSHVKAMASSLPPPPVAEKHTVEQLERIRVNNERNLCVCCSSLI